MSTVVAFHAHPDDEVLLTGGTLARLAAEGHRVVIVVACDGVFGAATGEGAGRRMAELRASAAVLGAARVEHLGYADSGSGPVVFEDPPDRQRFVRAGLEEAAGRLARLIREEDANLLLSYDPQGGYGHPDHVRVHQVGARAAELTGVRVLEGTMPRELVALGFWPARLLRLAVRYDPGVVLAGYTPRAAITHRVDVRRYAARKRAALATHYPQFHAKGRATRFMVLLTRLPVPVFALVAGREWFREPGAKSGAQRRDILEPA
jgi:LmbE family N-acetylglucosaminyl deacetylase